MISMTVKVQIEDTRLRHISANLRPRAGMVIRKLAADMVRQIDESMETTPLTGRWYFHGGRSHQASSEGNPPAIDTGTLVNSIQWRRIGELAAMVYTNSDHAIPLEFGTVNMAPRPFFLPAVEVTRRTLGLALDYLFKP